MSFTGCRFLAIVPFLAIAPTPLFAQSPAKVDEAYSQIAKAFKPVLVSSVPATLYEKTDNWGHEVMVPTGLKWRGLKATVTKSPRSHGEWRKMIITTQDLKRTLDLQIHDVKTINSEKQTFKVFLTFQMGVYYDQQNWESGIRLWSGSVRARTQVKVHMDCENTLKFNIDKNGLPDVSLRLRVIGAKVDYDNLVFEHVNGIGGDGAKLIGKAVHNAMKQWRPSIERDLLAKAGDAIVRAADTREIRIGFGGLVKK